MKKINLSWEKNATDEEFSEQEDEEVKYEYEEEAPSRNTGIGIVWFQNTDFYGVDTQILFDDKICPHSTINLGDEYVTMAIIGIQDLKNTVDSPIKTRRLIFTEVTQKMIVKYTDDYGSFKKKEWEDIKKSYLIYFISIILIAFIIERNN